MEDLNTNTNSNTNIGVLVNAKEEYTKQLVSILKPCIYQGIKSIYLDAKDICMQDNTPEKILMQFQELLSRIPKWSQDIINKEYERILNVSKCDYIEDLLKVPEVANNPALKGLIQAGQLSQVADYLYPKSTDQYNVFSMANYNNKPFNQLNPTEKQNVIKLVEESKKNSAMQVNLGSPVAGVDPETGQPVFFQASRTGGKPEIVPGIVPKAGEAQTKQIGGIDSLNSAIQSYKDKLKTWSPTDAADPNKRAQMKTVYNNMMLQAKEAYGLGVLNGPDYTILTDTIADPTTAKGVAYGAFGALEGQADTLSELMQRTKESLQGGKGIKPKENVPQGNQPKVIKFDSKGQRIN
jgi:hypothetical protein